jgi:hypothetical protein
MSETKQFVECLLCGALLKRITRTHLKHDISTDCYKSKFPIIFENDDTLYSHCKELIQKRLEKFSNIVS